MLDFDEALQQFAGVVYSVIGNRASCGRFLRDVFGRLSFIGGEPQTSDEDVKHIVAGLTQELRPYLAPREPALVARTPLAVNTLGEPGTAIRVVGTEYWLRLLDRRLAGEDWLRPPSSSVPAVPRFGFYGLKGGVGPSTAVAVSAADLAYGGSNVLVLDLDLEAPGQGSLLLDMDRLPDYGVVDWFAWGAIGIDAQPAIPDMVGGSPFTSGSGIVDVVPALGRRSTSRPESYLSRLARVYTPGAASGRLMHKSFTEKVEVLVDDLMENRSYDVVLIDVRAGLHETAAASLLGLGAQVFLFGVNSAQTIDDYNILFATIRQILESYPRDVDLRDRFKMVQAKALSDADRAQYRTKSWELWLNHLYDEVGQSADPTQFSFDLDDEDGPHYPLIIASSEIYNLFDPQRLPEHLTERHYGAVFEDFLSGIRTWIRRL